MGIFLRHSWNVKPPRWGSPADVQYAVMKNCEKIYGVDPDSIVLAMPLFWGLPPLDYSGKNNHGTNHGATYKDGSLAVDGTYDYVSHDAISFGNAVPHTCTARLKWRGGAVTTYVVPFGDNTDYQRAIYTAHIDGVKTFLYRTTFNNYPIAGVDTTILYDGVEHLLSWTVDSDRLVTVYIDGVFQGDTIIEETPIIYNSIARGWYHTGAYFWNGQLLEIRISKATRTADQIALFHDLPWALYQPVSRPVYFFQAAEGISIPVVDHHLQQHWRA